jgi:TM2 domain-containing membrane protein YozV
MTRDLRRYTRQTNTRLLAGGILILFLVGDGLIYLFYGRQAALMGLLCLLTGLAPLLLIWLILMAIEWVVKRANQEDQ